MSTEQTASSAATPRYRLPKLTDHQRAIVYLPPRGHQVVLGTAGSGKTLMAAHRAFTLASPHFGPNSGRTLLVTYNRALVGYIRHLMGPDTDAIDVDTFNKVALGYLSSVNRAGYNIIPDDESRERFMRKAISEVQKASGDSARLFDQPASFFFDEFAWMWGWGIKDFQEYLAAERRGRLRPLAPLSRERIWAIRESYLRLRKEASYKYDWWELPAPLLQALSEDKDARRYRHIVVDEAQDLPPVALQSLVALADPEGSVTVFADYAQQLYGRQASYKEAGLRIKRAELFKENYRNSEGIARLAIATSKLPYFTTSADLVEPVSPAVAGTPPTLVRVKSVTAGRNLIARQAADRSRTSRVAILAPTIWEAEKCVPQGVQAYPLKAEVGWGHSTGLHYGTYYSAKGLEFDSVFLPSIDESRFPTAGDIQAHGQDEASERAARLLYVGITRARSELLATFSEKLTPLVPAEDSGLWQVVDA